MPVVSVVIDPASGVDVLAAGVPKFGWLKDVEAFEAQLDLPIVAQLRDKKPLEDAAIEIRRARTIQDVAPGVAVINIAWKTSSGCEIVILTQLLCRYRLPGDTQLKFPASSMLPVPLYLATSG